jgi:hypothetical protein
MKKIIFCLVFILIIHCIRLGGMIEDCMSQWQPDVRLTNDPGYSYTSRNNAWCIATNGNVVHTVWYDGYLNYEIFYKRSTDGGINWGTDTRLTNNSAVSEYPSIAVSGSLVHIVWQDERDGNYEIYYKRSTDGGINWGADTRLTNNPTNSRYPSIAVSSSNVYTVWEDDRDGNYEIYYKRSTDAGLSWGADTRLTNNTSFSRFASITVSGSNVHTIWFDHRDGDEEIYYKRSTDAGLSWGADTRLTNNNGVSECPSITVSGSVVHVVWDDERHGITNPEIYYKRSTDGGINWGEDIRLTNYTANSNYPSIAVSGSLVHVVWEDTRDSNWEIYYKRSTDAGVNWGADTRLTNNISNSRYPSIALSGSIVHVVWYDNRDGGNGEIYYKRNPTGNTIGIKNISSEIPSSYSLQQNYPNPFNPTTKIKFDIAPSLSFPNAPIGNPLVVLKVFDLLGKELETLVNESALGGQPGTYEVQWDGTNYPSGVYFYKLITKGFTETKKMFLIK